MIELDSVAQGLIKPMRMRISSAASYSVHVSLALSLVAFVHVAVSASIDSFDAEANGKYITAIEQPDGRILIWGNFTSLAGQPRPGFGRLLADGTLDAGFNPQGTPSVGCVVIQADGKIIVGGHKTAPSPAVVRLNADGTQDASFRAEIDDYWAAHVYAMALQSDGRLLVGGQFESSRGNTNLARLNVDGTADLSFSPAVRKGIAAYARVHSLLLQPDGKIVLGGEFTTVCGEPRTNIARLLPDGVLDAAFAPNCRGTVDSLALQANGQILAGCFFWNLVEPPSSMLRLWPNGAVDQTFNPLVHGQVTSIVLQADGKILIGGSFATLFGMQGNGIARVHSDGTLDPQFLIWADAQANSLSLQSDGRLLVGGTFDRIGDASRTGFARVTTWDFSGVNRLTIEGSELKWMRSGPIPEVESASFFVSTNGNDWTSLGTGERIPDGWRVSGINIPPNSYVRALGTVCGGYMNGSRTLVESRLGPPVIVAHPQSVSAKLGADVPLTVKAAGSGGMSFLWLKNGSKFGGGMPWIYPDGTFTLTLTNISHLEEGDFSVVVLGSSGSVTSRVATVTVLDPTIEQQPKTQATYLGSSVTFNVTAGGTSPLSYQWRKDGLDLAGETGPALVLSDLRLDHRGEYQVVVSNAYGALTSSVARLNLFLSADAFNPGAGNSVRAFAELPGGKILVAGQFSALANEPCTNLGCLNPDGSLDPGFRAQLDADVRCLAVQPDGKILVGGVIRSAGGEQRRGLVRFQANGAVDTAFRPGFVGPLPWFSDMWLEVRALAVQPDGRILVGGQFSSMAGGVRNSLGRLNPDGTLDTSFDPGMQSVITNAMVSSLALQNDGKILVGGHQMRFGGVARMALARLHPDGSLDSSFPTDAQTLLTVLALQPDGSILIGGYLTSVGGQPRKGLARIAADGTVDPNFQPQLTGVPMSLVAQANGKLLVSGSLSLLNGASCGNLIRLKSDGSPDLDFNCDANGAVAAIGLQADGKILVGGSFTLLGGLPRQSIGRLSNIESATETLVVEGSSIKWLRDGGTPEVSNATFEGSTNQIDWVALGAAKPIPGGWQAEPGREPNSPRKLDADPPFAFSFLRARGTVTGGNENCSTWPVQTLVQLLRITTQPSNQAAALGSTASFTVVADGPGPLSYQWCKDGSPLADSDFVTGTRTPVLVLSNLLMDAAGDYAVVIAGGAQNVTSRVAALVVEGITVATPPLDQTVNAGLNVNLTVAVSGPEPLSFQWLKDDVALADGPAVSGVTTPSLWLTNVFGADSGAYQVVVSHGLLTATSAVAVVSVNDPVITVPPTNYHVGLCDPLELFVGALGTPPLSFQWRKNGLDLPHATNSPFVLPLIAESDAGSYQVLVTSKYGTALSSPALVTVDAPAMTPPVLRLNAGSSSPSFQFTLSGVCGQVIILESSTNLIDWIPVATNRTDSTPLSFSDSREGAQARFYRARLQ